MSRLRVDLELFIAIEAIQKANRLYPGTVIGIVFHSQVGIEKDYANATLVLDVIKKVELKVIPYQIKIGTKQNCEGIYSGTDDTGEKRRQILKHSNFIICEVTPSTDMKVTEAVVWVIGKIIKYRKELKTLNPWINVMFETGWPADEGNKSQTGELQAFWEDLESWSLKYNVDLWMNEAFDNPWSYLDTSKNWGWWKLKSDEGIGQEDGYIEKIKHAGVKYTKKTRGKAMASGVKRVEKIEKLIKPGGVEKAKGVEVKTEKDEEVAVPD